MGEASNVLTMFKKNIHLADGKDYGTEQREIRHWRCYDSRTSTNRKAHESCGLTWRQSGKYVTPFRYEYYAYRRSFKRARKQLIRNLKDQILEL